MKKFKIAGILAVALLLSVVMTACGGCSETDEEDKVLTGITVRDQPTQKAYLVGEEFKPAGMVIMASYDDATSVPVTNYEYSPRGALKLTDTVITVTFTVGDITKIAEVPITVREVTKLEVTAKPTKTQYNAGDAFVPAGMVVTATFHNGTSEPVTGYDYSPKIISTAADANVKVTYGGKEAEVVVGLFDSIKVTKNPAKMDYTEGEQFVPAGMEVAAVYTDQSEGSPMTTGFDYSPKTALEADASNKAAITVTYNGKSVNLAVNVKKVASLAITKAPAKISGYINGDKFEPEGIEIEVTYSNGSKDTIEWGEAGLDYDLKGDLEGTASANATDVVFSYGYGAGKTVTQKIDVRTLASLEVSYGAAFETACVTGEPLGTQGLVVTAKYNRGADRVLSSGEYSFGDAVVLKKHESEGYRVIYSPNASASVTGFVTGLTVYVPVVGFGLHLETLPLYLGSVGEAYKTGQLVASFVSKEPGVSPDNMGFDWAVTYADGTEAEGIITVEPVVADGRVILLIEAEGVEGEVTITVTPDDGYSPGLKAKCAVIVSYPIEIRTAADFMQIYENRNGFFFLTANIDFAGVDLVSPIVARGEPPWEGTAIPGHPGATWVNSPWLVLGTEWYVDHPSFWNGIFDGRGYALENITLRHSGQKVDKNSPTGFSSETYGASLFGVIGKTGVVRNLAILDYTITAAPSNTGQLGVLAQHNHGVIENCYLEDIKIATNSAGDAYCRSGAIVAYNYNKIDGCVVASVYSEQAAGNNRVYGVLTANRRNWITFGDVTNTFAVVDGLPEAIRSEAGTRNGFAAYGGPNMDAGRPAHQGYTSTWANSAAFLLADIADHESKFAALDSTVWTLTAGKLPALKQLPAFASINVEDVAILCGGEEVDGAINMMAREELQLTAVVSPANATYRRVEWVSSDEEVVTVTQNGLLVAVGEGSATVTAKSRADESVYAECEIVVDGYIFAEEVAISLTELTLTINRLGEYQSRRLTADVQPKFADKAIVWSSSDDEIATVNDNGLVTAVADGECVIRVAAVDSENAGEVYAECAVTVIENLDKIQLYSNQTTTNRNYICDITIAANPSLEFARGPTVPLGNGAIYFTEAGKEFCVGLQIAVFDTADESAPVGYFWVIGGAGVTGLNAADGYIIVSQDPKDADALPKLDATASEWITLSNMGGGLGNLYLPTANTNGALRNIISAMDSTPMTGTKTFKMQGRFVAVEDTGEFENDYQSGTWGLLTERAFTLTF